MKDYFLKPQYSYSLEIKEHHLDTFGHVNNATYLNLYEQARWEILNERGYSIADIKQKEMGPVILRAEISFKRELMLRKKITINSQLQEIRTPKIMDVRQEMITDNGKLASELILTLGLMDLKERKLIPFTDEWLYPWKG